jgi:hypothetical protein
MILVSLTLANICFIYNSIYGCYPVLIGNQTPVGEYHLVNRLVIHAGYGGDVLQYFEDEKQVYAIHRIWLLNPKQHRLERINDPNPKNHVITDGCINVMPEVYDKLKDCCSNDQLSIVP